MPHDLMVMGSVPAITEVSTRVFVKKSIELHIIWGDAVLKN